MLRLPSNTKHDLPRIKLFAKKKIGSKYENTNKSNKLVNKEIICWFRSTKKTLHISPGANHCPE